MSSLKKAEQTLREVLDAFDFGAPVESAVRYGQGHINDTFVVCACPEDARCRTQLKLVADMEEHWRELEDIAGRHRT